MFFWNRLFPFRRPVTKSGTTGDNAWCVWCTLSSTGRVFGSVWSDWATLQRQSEKKWVRQEMSKMGRRSKTRRRKSLNPVLPFRSISYNVYAYCRKSSCRITCCSAVNPWKIKQIGHSMELTMEIIDWKSHCRDTISHTRKINGNWLNIPRFIFFGRILSGAAKNHREIQMLPKLPKFGSQKNTRT